MYWGISGGEGGRGGGREGRKGGERKGERKREDIFKSSTRGIITKATHLAKTSNDNQL